VDQVAKLKADTQGDVVVHGSATLVHALVDKGLVDEFRLMVFPVILGGGRHLFGHTGAPAPLRLVDSQVEVSDPGRLTGSYGMGVSTPSW
jgi:dihydrofolate reductase